MPMSAERHTTNAAVRGPNRIAPIANHSTDRVGEPAAPLMRDLDVDAPPGLSPEDARRANWRLFSGRLALGLLTLFVLVGGWWALAVLGNYPPYILPTPPLVAERAWGMILSGSLFGHFWTTFLETGLGFSLALIVGLALGYPMARSHLFERLANPYIGVSRGLPVVAIAPLLVIWFNDDLLRNIVVVALIVFFPILVNTIVGLRGIDRSLLEMGRISGANFWQMVWYVELPLGLRALLGGVKVGLTLSVTGAVVGELISANSGLGFLIALGRSNYDTPLMFVSLASLVIFTMGLYAFVTVLEKVLVEE